MWSSVTASKILLSTALRYMCVYHLCLPSSPHLSSVAPFFSSCLSLSCSDGIDAVRGCVEEMKGQLPLDGVATSSRMVSVALFGDLGSTQSSLVVYGDASFYTHIQGSS